MMLSLFHDESGNDVIEDPPSMLIIIGIVNSMIVSIIFWILMVIFIPLIPGSKKKGGSRSGGGSKTTYRNKKKWWHYRARHQRYYSRRYIFFGPQRERHSINNYWIAAMGGKNLDYPNRKKVELLKKEMCEKLNQETIIPSNRDFKEFFPEENQLLFDIALEELLESKMVKYCREANHYFSKGFCLTEQYKKSMIKEPEDVETQRDKMRQIFLDEIKKQLPVKNKETLWMIGNELKIRPLWLINSLIDDFRKERKMKYSRSKPRGWSVN